MSDKQHLIKIEGFHADFVCKPYRGVFVITFYGNTAKDKRYKIEITMRMYFISFLVKKFIEAKAEIQKMMNKEFENINDPT